MTAFLAPEEDPPKTTASILLSPRLAVARRLKPEAVVKPVLSPSMPGYVNSMVLWLRYAWPSYSKKRVLKIFERSG